MTDLRCVPPRLHTHLHFMLMSILSDQPPRRNRAQHWLSPLRFPRHRLRSARKPQRADLRSTLCRDLLYACDARHGHSAQRRLSRAFDQYVLLPCHTTYAQCLMLHLSQDPRRLAPLAFAHGSGLWWERPHLAAYRRCRAQGVPRMCRQPGMHQVCVPPTQVVHVD